MAIEHSVDTQQYLIYSKILGIQTYFVEFADLQKQKLFNYFCLNK